MTDSTPSPPALSDPTRFEPHQAARADALLAALIGIERHIGASGWDQPARLFALVRTDQLIQAEPQLAEQLGLDADAAPLAPDALTSIEQEDFTGNEVLDALATIVWPDSVQGCAVSVERTFLPASSEIEIPDDPAAAAEFVANQPDRQDIRVVMAVDRAGNRHGVARIVSHPDELLGGTDLVPGLAEALAHTLSE